MKWLIIWFVVAAIVAWIIGRSIYLAERRADNNIGLQCGAQVSGKGRCAYYLGHRWPHDRPDWVDDLRG